MQELGLKAKMCGAPCACHLPARLNGLCVPHHRRLERGKPIDTPIKTRNRASVCSGCGVRPPYTKGLCDPCYQVGARAKMKVVAGTQTDDWFDWVQVERAWYSPGKSLPRNLTHPERMMLAWLAARSGECRPSYLRATLRMELDSAVRLVESVRSGEVRVMGRDWQGRPTQPLSAPGR